MNIKLEKTCLLPFILLQIFKLSISINTINSTQPLIDDGNHVISTNQVFSLGFFSPGESTRRFVGIWYSKVPQTVVWVLNRDNPINGTAGVLTVDDNRGNLVLYENNQTRGNPLWSSKVNVSSSTAPFEAQLLDSGNLVLVDRKNSSNWIWESFDFPTDTTIPNMKLGVNRKTGKNWFLSSWKSRDDPSTGNIFLRINPAGFPQVFLYNGSVPLWRSGPWIGQRWSGIAMAPSKVFKPTFVNNKDEVSITYSFFDMTVASSILTRKTVNESGIFEQTAWNSPSWVELWSGPKEPCDKYGRCGTNSKCEPNDSSNFKCECLPGFEPKSAENGSDGCIRKTGASTCQNMEGFIKLTNVKLPDTSIARANMSMELKACEEKCLKNCSCTAYTSADESGIGCLNWYGDLIDTTNFSDAGQDLYVRVDATELGKYMKSKGPLANGRFKAIIIVSVLVPFFSIFAIYYLIKKMRKGRDRRRRNRFLIGLIDQGSENGKGNDDEGGISDLPFFDLSVIAAVTNSFSDDNKLGKGGFGTVYKGVLPGGKEIAVKRLSKYSGQGNDEFKNEVALIAKLQHRNLVKMLGYCIQDQEKMLIYEFLPNKSLDTFIFDDTKRALLNWSMRYEIICGIARGILYLHQDSRLRIIHRDLKASNILLDASMKPKISDFGMARIFEANQIEAETHRVVGTYGYMAPEYAMQGQFSVKSDVYSFGILLLEIISGRKNSSFYNEIRFSNLAGHVWELWREGRAMEIVDESVSSTQSNQRAEIERCIQIGLLCVQESAMDRPTMSVVVLMLSNDTVLASPKQPAFILKTNYNNIEDPSTSSRGTNSVNSMSETVLLPR